MSKARCVLGALLVVVGVSTSCSSDSEKPSDTAAPTARPSDPPFTVESTAAVEDAVADTPEKRLVMVARAVADAYESLGYERIEGDDPTPTSDYFIIGRAVDPVLFIGLYATLSEPPGDVTLVGSHNVGDLIVELYDLADNTGPWVVCDDVGVSIQGPDGNDAPIEVLRQLLTLLDCS